MSKYRHIHVFVFCLYQNNDRLEMWPSSSGDNGRNNLSFTAVRPVQPITTWNEGKFWVQQSYSERKANWTLYMAHRMQTACHYFKSASHSARVTSRNIPLKRWCATTHRVASAAIALKQKSPQLIIHGRKKPRILFTAQYKQWVVKPFPHEPVTAIYFFGSVLARVQFRHKYWFGSTPWSEVCLS